MSATTLEYIFDEFRAALRRRRIIPPAEFLADGRIHRCDVEGRRGKGDGAYQLHLDGVPAGGFQNWRDGRGWEKWRADIGRTLSQAEEAAHKARIEALRREREAEEAGRKAEARRRAAAIWKAAHPVVDDHPYLRAKSVKGHGLRVHKGTIVVPICDTAGELHSLQFIGTDGSKRFLIGGRVHGCYCGIGKPDGVLCIVEGYATGASVHEATGYAVAVAFNAGNLVPVAREIRAKYPGLRLTLCSDDDHSTDDNPGLSKAQEAAVAVGGFLAVPDFGEHRPEGATDFNDLHVTGGLEAVRLCIESAKAQNPRGQPNEEVEKPFDPLEGLKTLPEKPTSEALEAGLRRFGAAMALLDPISAAVARNHALGLLKERGCHSPARLVDASVVKAANKKDEHQGQAFELKDPVLWPEPVTGVALLEEIISVLRRFVSLPDGAAEAVALWILHAHTHDAFGISPILCIQSPEKRCGKTTLLTILGALVPKPMQAANLTAAALFRGVEKFRPTLLLDEAETFLDDSELRGILNSGHLRSSAWVIRIVGEDMEPRRFLTWAPKAIALIGKLHPTLDDRSVVVRMRRRTLDERVESLRWDQLEEFEPIQSRAARWAADHVEQLRAANPQIPSEITSDRSRDNWRPLLAIADLLGAEWPSPARRAAITLEAGRDGDESTKMLLLVDLRRLFIERGADRLSSEDIVTALSEMEDRPWCDWNKGRGLTKTGLAGLLRPFNIKPKGIRLENGKTPRGYLFADCEDSFARYLPPLDEVQHCNNEDGAVVHEEVQVQRHPCSVAPIEPHESNSDAVCCTVAVCQPLQEGVNAESRSLLEVTI